MRKAIKVLETLVLGRREYWLAIARLIVHDPSPQAMACKTLTELDHVYDDWTRTETEAESPNLPQDDVAGFAG